MTYRFGWTSPVATSPFDTNIIYHGANVLFRTEDQGETWTQISPDLTRNETNHHGRSGLWWHDGSGGEIYDTLFSVVESPHERGTIWAGTDDGLVQLTRDGGRTWTNVTPADWAEGWVYIIEVSPHDNATAYVAVSRHRTGDPGPHFYKTTDYGRTWTDLAVTLPQDYPARVVREDPKRPGLLFAATEYDVWVSFDGGGHWQTFQQNLPHVPISDLTIHGDDLIAATEGRGFWILDDITPVRAMAPDIAKADLHLFKPQTTDRIAVVASHSLAPSGANPPVGVLIRYSLERQLTPSDNLKLEILNTRGEVVRTYRPARPTDSPTPAAPGKDASESKVPAAKPDSSAKPATAAAAKEGPSASPTPSEPGKAANESKASTPQPESSAKPATGAATDKTSAEEPAEQSDEEEGEEGHTPAAKHPVVLTGDKGLNQVVWDFRGAPLSGTTGTGPLLPSGKYTVRMTLGLTTGMTTVSEPLEVVPDPRTQSAPESQLEHLALTRELMKVGADTNAASAQVKDVLKQTKELKSHAEAAPAKTREAISSFAEQLDALDKQFKPYQPDPKAMAGDQRVLTVGAGPIGLLSTLQSAVDTNDGPITQGERLRAKELEAECVHLRTVAETALSAGIANVNALAAAAGLKPAITRHPVSETTPAAKTPPVPEAAIRSGKASVRGKEIPYRVETAEMIMRNAAGAPRATIFSVSYMAETATVESRPVTFIFNGGPGGATWPLREAISPKMIVPAQAAPGFAFANNPDSLIDASDLVFIDAPGTGYSRFLTEDAKPEFWGIEEDGRAFAEFIANWLENHNRGASPKFILGESYGGTRTAEILKTLASRPEGPIRFQGVVLVSPTLGTGSADPLTQGAAALPTEAVTARYYGRGAYTSKTVEEVAADAQAFTTRFFDTALRAGKTLSEVRRKEIARQVSVFIGISPDEILKSDLVVPTMKFRDLLLADKGEQLGSDARQHHPKPKPGQAESVLDTANGYDLQAAIVSLIRDELGYKAVGPYVRDPVEANRAWDNTITSEPSSLPEILKAAAAADPHFHVFLGGGYFDFIVPYFLPLSSLRAAELPPNQFVHHIYPSAHAFLNDEKNRARATDDLRVFYREAPLK
jgi:carboxypeptidase C (cathepsin A)